MNEGFKFMKPCANWKRAIALQAVQDLETDGQTSLKEHLAHCAGCSEYLREMRSLSRDLTSLETRSQPEAPLILHNRIETSLRKNRPTVPVFGFAAVLRIQ
ncbi:MAG: hypothetical protein JWM99_4970, partial [Verrucomicrobiales bacterium]|nr:hypothetical protein [Verrucomicrobiales bacterium]